MSFVDTQRQFAAHLRDPQTNPPPEGIERRRLAIYQDLVFNNIASFLSSGFPVLRSLYDDEAWITLVRKFIVQHQAETPYFLEISEEFLRFLQESYAPTEQDPPFMLELAHYEWVELALDVSEEVFPSQLPTLDVLKDVPAVSPLVWRLSYQYPVHLLGPEFQPCEPPEAPTFLLVYRNRNDEVRFMESNALTIRLLNLLEQGLSGRSALLKLAHEMQHPDPEALVIMGHELLLKLHACEILI